MNKPSRTTEFFVWGGLAAIIAAIAGAFIWSKTNSGELFGGKPLPIDGGLPGFTLTNQNNQAVTLADLRGQVWVADIIFTRCPGPCEKMTRQMNELQSALPANGLVKLVSLTSDPDFDAPPVLKKYAERFGANPDRWIFLTGSKTEIYKLAIEGLKLTAIEKKPEERESERDLFIHSTIFVLVDKQARFRGAFETTGDDVDWPKMKEEILAAAKKLAREK